jgi:D-alanine--poly(phosphoribitol) ligase subunit 2
MEGFLMDTKQVILGILEEICETDIVKENLDIQLFEEGLLDSFGTVSLLVEIETRLNVNVPISDFDREEWATPKLIIEKVEQYR